MNQASKLVIALFVVVALFAFVGLLWRAVTKPVSPSDPMDVACTMDAKLCPDGSSVGRVPPSCEFAACPTAVPSTSITPPPMPPTNTTGTEPWVTTTTNGNTFSYPPAIGTEYVSTVDWPPTVRVQRAVPFVCTVAGDVTAPAGKTELVTIEGHEYCLTRESEGAAGSVYTQYAYTFPRQSDVVTLTFSLRAVQCLNYDEPRRSTCTREQATFTANKLADQMAQSVQLGVN